MDSYQNIPDDLGNDSIALKKPIQAAPYPTTLPYEARRPIADVSSANYTPTVTDIQPAPHQLGSETPIASDETFAIRKP